MRQPKSSSTGQARGFTLVELMVVVLIISILAAIAIPSYQYEVRKGRRTDAKSALLDLAGREERIYAATNSYSTDQAALGYATTTGVLSNVAVGSGYYQVTAAAGAAGIASSYLITATPTAGSQQLKDTACQYFAVYNTGNQYAGTASPGVTGSACWQ